ncbi:hypothetical protein GCM10009789_06830 [Kribbella sancticallisti]|uniref:WYL domain-containing protein n=1 Tax=Kribbella sancticallisti TaxID=460087 RepID=A0ABP4N8F6_9ACTN
MPSDLAINLVATFIAFLTGLFARSAYHRLRGKALQRNRKRIMEQRHPTFTAPWLVNYYRENGHVDDLYAAEFGDGVVQVPFLVRPTWHLDNVSEDELIDQAMPQRQATVPIDRKLLKRRGRYLSLTDRHGEPWNDLIACAKGVSETEAGPRIQLQVAEYFQYLSACGPLEDETYRAVRTARAKTPIRDRVLSSAAEAARCDLGAHAFGMQVAVVFDDGQRLRILIQRRSYSVSIYGGALAVVPVFGCQTTDLTANTRVSLFHNFLREVYEELYGGAEVEQKTARVDPAWFYREAPIERLIKARSTGQLDFRLLGFGFDALNGEMDVLALALFKESRFSRIELSEMAMNWEINDIQVWDLFGQELTDALTAGEFSPGSVYTIMRCRQQLRGQLPAPA